MRRAAKVDANQAEIVKALREVGATVQSLAAVGDGCPDLLVGCAGWLFLFEVKDPAQKPSARKLTPDQVYWHGNWLGHAHVIEQSLQAIDIMRAHVAQYGAR